MAPSERSVGNGQNAETAACSAAQNAPRKALEANEGMKKCRPF
jgi:hypothetical protein